MPVAAANLEELARRVGAERLRREADATARFQVDGVTPTAVVEPANAEELSATIRWAREHGAALLPATSGLYLPLGNPPRAADVAVSLARLNRVVYYDPADLTLGVEAGLPLGQVQELLAQNGLFLPADPPYGDRAALGGLVAANASGPLRFGFGTWRDFVVGLKFVTGEGTLVKSGGRVVKNVAGYDLTKLLIGSLGTLGVITEINFKAFPRPPETAAIVMGFDDLAPALVARLRVAHSAWQPRALELVSREAARLAGVEAAATARWSLVVGGGGVPRALERLTVELEGVARANKATGFSLLRGEQEASLWAGLRGLVERARQQNPSATVVKCPLPLTQLGPFLERALGVAARYELPAAATAHAGTAVAWIVLLPPAGMADAARRMAQAATEMIHAGNNLGGRVSIPWCPTEVKRDVAPWGPLRDDFTLMQKLKQQFDPDGVLNPGRFVGGL